MTDTEFIDKHGGTAKFARLMGVRVNVVTNWRTRGIPSYVKVANPKLFFGDLESRPELTKEAADA